MLGFCIAFLGFDFWRANAAGSNALAPFFPFLMAAVPLLDTVLAVVRRLLGRVPLQLGDRGHYYDLLLASGWSSRKVALTTYALTAAMCSIAWVVLECAFRNGALLCAVSVVALIVAAVRLGSLRLNEGASQKARMSVVR